MGIYLGYRELVLTDDELSDFYSGLYEFPADLARNEYVIIKNVEGAIVAKTRYDGEAMIQVRYPTITNRSMTVCGRNEYQYCAIDLLLARNIPVKLLLGTSGSGKDLLMSAAAMALIDRGKFQKIVYIRPNVTIEGVPDIGYRKGDTFQKLAWTLGPLIDKYGGQQAIENLIRRELLELVPLMEIRGRSFDNAIIYVSEGQNLTTNVLRSIITRAGEKTEVWLNGDIAQIDREIYREHNGITQMANKFRDNPMFGCMYLPIVERSAVAKLGSLLEESE